MFIDNFPNEEEKRLNHLISRVKKDPLFTTKYFTDIGDITTEYDTLNYSKAKGTLSKKGGSVFILNFDKKQSDPYKRYTLGLVDVKIKNM